MDSAARVLSSKGDKLHIHETHIRGIADGKFLVTHDLRNKHGHPPMDGQRDRREHSVDNVKELAQHIADNPPEPPDGPPPPEPPDDQDAGEQE